MLYSLRYVCYSWSQIILISIYKIMVEYTLLLVDDHAVVRSGLRNALSDVPGIRIIGELGNGKAVFTALEKSQPDCLLIDINMPDFDPIADIGRIRERYPQVKILVVSAYNDDVYVQGLLGVGVDGYHLKDQPLDDLRLAVQRVLQGEKWVSGRIVDQLVHIQREPHPQIQLTSRQIDLLRLLQKGLDNRSIASRLSLSVKTVENHLTRLYRELEVNSRLEAVHYLTQNPEILAYQGAESEHNAPSDTSSGQCSILVVDDNARYRQQLLKMLRAVDTQIMLYQAQDSAETRLHLQRSSPALIFLDIVLGDENGIQLIPQIRNLSPASRIVLFSAYPDSEFRRRGMGAGAVAFLDKRDIDFACLRQMVDDLI